MTALRTALIIILLTIGPSLAQAQDQKASPSIDPEKAALINQLIEMSGAVKLAKSNMDQAISIAEVKADPKEKANLERLRNKFNASELITLVMPIYDRHLSTDDLKGLIAFYKSPLGEKVLKEMPAIMRESIAAGQQWGASKAVELQKELEAEKNATAK